MTGRPYPVAYERAAVGLAMPGVPGVSKVPQQPGSFDLVLEELHDYTEYSVDGEWEGQVRWIGSRFPYGLE